MPASPPAIIEISGLAAQPSGWFVDYQNGNAREVVCWGLLLDNTGAVPMVFDQASQKIVAANTIGEYVLFHGSAHDSIVTLIENATEPAESQVTSLGGMYSRKSTYVIADSDVTFSARLLGSLDNQYWFDIGILDSPGVESEVLRTVHYVQAILDSVSGGPVTIRLAWS